MSKRKKLINYLMREQGYSDQAAEREADARLREEAQAKRDRKQEVTWLLDSVRRGPINPGHGI